MAGPIVLTPIVAHEVIEGRIYAVWRDQEYITKFYWRAVADTGMGPATTQDVATSLQAKWQLHLAELVPTDFTVRQYWAARVKLVTLTVVEGVNRWKVTYDEPSVQLGDDDDVGSNIDSEWLPTIDASTLNRFAALRNKNWRSNIRFGPVPESGQNKGLLEDAWMTSLNTQLELFAKDVFWIPATYTVQLVACLFAPALATLLTQPTMDEASQDVLAWRASRLVGTQRTRKIRAAGY